MKLMIASDLHGSAYWVKKLFERMEEEQPEKLLLLGDLLYHGPRNDLPRDYNTKEVAALLNQHKDKILSVRGNCESEVDQEMLEFPALAQYAWLWVDGRNWILVHGHDKGIHNIPHTPGTLFIQGHTHVPLAKDQEDGATIWAGSVSIPKGGSVNSYMIYEDGVFMWKQVEDGKELQRHAL